MMWFTALALSASPALAGAQDTLALQPFSFLAGGTWRGTGRWPDSSRVDVEVRYCWGPTRRMLHFVTWDLETGERKLLYEGMIFYDPARGRVVQWNMKTGGQLDISEYSRVEPGRFEVEGAHTRSLVRQSGPDEFHWELRVPKGDDWPLILDATYRRTIGGEAACPP